MTKVLFKLSDFSAKGVVPTNAHMTFQPTAIHHEDETLITAKPFNVVFKGDVAVELDSTTDKWVWSIRISDNFTPIIAGFYMVPDQDEIPFKELPEISPYTIEPENVWFSMARSTVNWGEVIGDDLWLSRTDGKRVNVGRVVGKDGKPSTVPGPLTTLTGGNVTKLPPGSNPTAEVVGNLNQKRLNLGLVTGDPGLNGSNVLPTNQAIAQAIQTEGETKTALNAATVQKYTSTAPGVGTQQVFSDVAVRGKLKGTYFGVGGHIGSERQPMGVGIVYDAAKLEPSGGDKVAFAHNVVFTGDFTAETTRPGAAPRWLWGSNDFILLGPLSGATPILGISEAWARLTEIHVNTPNSTYNNIHGLIGESKVGPQGVGTTITGWLASVKASGPKNEAGANVAYAASLLITSPAPGTATNQYALYISGGEKSRFGGDIEMSNGIAEPKYINAHYGGFKGASVALGNPDKTMAVDTMFNIVNRKASDVGIRVGAAGGQSADLMQLVYGVTVSRFDSRGRLSLNTGAPTIPDADARSNEITFSVEQIAGGLKLVLKGKDGNGVVRQGEVTLA